MTLEQYIKKYEYELDDLWNESARFQYVNWDSFVKSMYQNYKRKEGIWPSFYFCITDDFSALPRLDPSQYVTPAAMNPET